MSQVDITAVFLIALYFVIAIIGTIFIQVQHLFRKKRLKNKHNYKIGDTVQYKKRRWVINCLLKNIVCLRLEDNYSITETAYYYELKKIKQ